MKFKIDNLLKIAIGLIFLRNPLFIFFIFSYFFFNLKIASFFFIRILPFLFVLVCFVLYSFSIGNEDFYILSQSSDILLSIIIFLFLASVSYNKYSSNQDYGVVYRSIKFFLLLISSLKILLIFLSTFIGFSIIDILEKISDIWKINLMTMGVGDTNLSRLQLPVDSVLPFCIYFLLFEFLKSNSKKFILVSQLLLLSISLILTFSRAFWLITFTLIFLFVVMNIELKQKIKFILSSAFLFFVLSFIPSIRSTLISAVTARFGKVAADVNYYSDLERILQNRLLFSKFLEAPFFGNGFGYYLPNFIRSSDVKYLYESQSLSILMNLGLIGTLILFGLILYNIYYFNYQVSLSFINKIIVPFFLFIIWVMLGSTNPLLFGASGGVILFFCASYSFHFRNCKNRT